MYGVPGYKEVNPALFTTVTFPFLFGVMFGDIGHGSLLLFFASVMCLMPKPKVTNPIYEARYLFLLMGTFSMYCGFIYNDFMSIPLDLFGSCYNSDTGRKNLEDSENCVYSFGIDPIWFMSK
jgi:V-type H+-transporting ATPase subunit a